VVTLSPDALEAVARLLEDALEQVELADRLGIDYLWDVEHHLL
jgi:alkanesulfonate monooxygenase SsuD/methylene tetrahydromethanopterin reductase-like flavin-dependent oxidoreductase (luciferase family)